MSDKKPTPGLPWAKAFRTATAFSAILLLMAKHRTGDMMAIYEGLTVWAVPAIFMLWGMNDLEEGQSSISFTLTKRLLPAIGTLLIWGVIYGLLDLGLNGGGFSVKSVLGVLTDLFTGQGAEHLWVLYPLLGLYLVYPILQRFTAGATRGEAFYILLMCFLFSALFPHLEKLIPECAVWDALENLHIHTVVGWVGCYLAGWYLKHFPIRNLTEDLIYILGIGGQIFTLTGDHVFGGGYSLWYDYSAPNVVLTALAMCTLFRYVLDDRAGRNNHSLGSFAMGIYFFHQVWAMIFNHYGLNFSFMPDALAVPLLSVIMFLLSIPVAMVLSKIPKLGRMLT